MTKLIFILVFGVLFLSWGLFDLTAINEAFSSVLGMLNNDIIYYFTHVYESFVSYANLMLILSYIIILYIIGKVFQFIFNGGSLHLSTLGSDTRRSLKVDNRKEKIRSRKEKLLINSKKRQIVKSSRKMKNNSNPYSKKWKLVKDSHRRV